jgi:hypothetical protein
MDWVVRIKVRINITNDTFGIEIKRPFLMSSDVRVELASKYFGRHYCGNDWSLLDVEVL